MVGPNPDDAFSVIVFEQTWDLLATTPDDASLAPVKIGRNEADGQYVVMTDQQSGHTRVLDLAAGAVRTEGNLGEDYRVVAVGDTIYVHVGETGEVRAHAADDLTTVRWRASLPPSRVSNVWACGRQTLCLFTDVSTGLTLIAIDATNGREIWRRNATAHDIRQAGGDLALAHGDGTDIIDPRTGDVRETLAGPVFAHAGDSLAIGGSEAEVFVYDPVRDKSTVLGAAPDAAVVDGDCDWGRAVVLCADATEFVLSRYRG